ncbi:hypothetical protein G7084_03520 [Weissella coleopterorum]|uniref:Uncharacterized protein n=1 Tax=Weissella coleopterorum TaxID=2714949 RepID=A0A6G8AZQ3_9LACO|nr:hypothetical protein [Weissella coleopterorum]QIL50467.1 hypothetical protein G7084_03520 [Weissella coleopterorum]
MERRSRFIWAIKISDSTKKSMNKFGSTDKSITVYHGKEFSSYQKLNEKYKLPVYF